MKKWLVFLCIVICLTACKRKTTNQEVYKETEKINTDITYDSLSDEQKGILENMAFSKEDIENMNFEEINFNLLGTGYELYNTSTGTEINGVSYIIKNEDEFKAFLSDNEKGKKGTITLQEAKAVRSKENDMTLENFLPYKYSVNMVENTSNYYRLAIPLEEYDNTYVSVYFGRNEQGIVHMTVPVVEYMEEDMVMQKFSIYYDEPLLKVFFDNNQGFIDKTFGKVQYSSVTADSLVLDIYNYTKNMYFLDKSYELYKVNNGKEELIEKWTDESQNKDVLLSMSFTINRVNFSTPLEKGSYILRFGKEENNYFYYEFLFEE